MKHNCQCSNPAYILSKLVLLISITSTILITGASAAFFQSFPNNHVTRTQSKNKQHHPHTILYTISKETARKAIQEALEISKKYGAQSQEARVAWDIAEELEDSVYLPPCSKRCEGSGDEYCMEEQCPF